ncbi:suppressor of fused domain protein [Fuerstiella marisgermanici]|uniref:suppressor of fused domain protein n=1 Tax=Fuerstiella marisgermanici TaxID=1891926 RepID=UPI00097BBC85
MSNAWEDAQPDPSGVSGLGCEFVFETATQGEWAILRVQQIMAFQILLAHGRFPGRDLLDVFDRIPLRGPITPEPSQLTHIMVAPPVGDSPSFQLDSGHVDFLALVGITDAEAQFARHYDGERCWPG